MHVQYFEFILHLRSQQNKAQRTVNLKIRSFLAIILGIYLLRLFKGKEDRMSLKPHQWFGSLNAGEIGKL